MYKSQTARKSGVIAPKAIVSKNVSQYLSDSSSDGETFQSTQAPSMTQKLKAAADSSDSDFSSDLDEPSPARGSKLAGKPQLLGISPILAKLSGKDTSTPLKGSKATPTKNPPKSTKPMGSSDSDTDESEAAVPTTQGRSNVSANASMVQKRESDASESEYDAPWSPSKQAPALLKVNGTKGSDSGSDSGSDDQEANAPVPLQSMSQSLTKKNNKNASDCDSESDSDNEDAYKAPVLSKLRSPTKAKVPTATDSDSELDSDDEEADKSPVLPKLLSPTKASVPNALDSDSEVDSSEDEHENPPKPAVQPKMLSPKKASVPNASDSDSDLDSGEEESPPKPAAQSKVQSPKKASVPNASDSDSDLESGEEESPPKPAVQPKVQSPKKARVPNASDSDSDSDSGEEESPPKPAVQPKVQSPKKASVPNASDSDSDSDSGEEESPPKPAVQPKVQSPKKASVPNASDSDSDSDSGEEESPPKPAVQPKVQSPKKASVPNASESDSDLDSSEEESPPKPAVQPKVQSPKKAAVVQKSSESELESSSDDDETKIPLTGKPKPASPAKQSTPGATAMEVDDSSDEEAMIREAMSQVNQAEERAKAGVFLRKSAPVANSETDSDSEPKGKKTPKGTPKQPVPKETGSFLSKATISDSDEVSSDSEPEKLGPIRQNTSLKLGNKSITTPARKGMEQDQSESSASDVEEAEAVPITDSSPGLLYLEDLASNDEVWLVRCPVDAKSSDLIGRKLVLGGTSKFMLGDDEFESRTYKHADSLSRLTCLLRSKDVDGLLKVVSVPTAGQVTFTRKVKLPPVALPATTSSEGKTTALPLGLKTRHPLFGADFQQAITVRDKTEDRPQTKVKSPKKDSKRRSVTFREKPSFESTQQSIPESASEKEEEKEKVEESIVESDASDDGPAPNDMMAMMLSKALLDRQVTSLKLAKSAKSSKAAANTSIDRQSEAGQKVPTSKRKSLQSKKSLTTIMIEKQLAEISSPVDKSGAKKSKKTIASPAEGLNSKTKSKSLVSTPISNHQSLTSFSDDSDFSVSVSKTPQAKVSKKKVNSKTETPASVTENLTNLLGDSDSSFASKKTSLSKSSKKKSISSIESPAAQAKQVASMLDVSDSSVSMLKSSQKKGSKKMDISNIETKFSKAKKDSSLVDNSDSSVSKRKTSLPKKEGSKAESSLKSKKTAILNLSESSITKPITSNDDMHAADPSSAKKKSRKSESSLSNTLLANFLNKSLSTTTKKLIENTATDQDSHLKSKAESLKAAASILDSSDTSAPKSKVSKISDDSPSDSSTTKAKRKSRKSEILKSDTCLNSSTIESPLNQSKTSNAKDSKTNTSVNELKKTETKIDSVSSNSEANILANSSSLSSKMKTPKEKTEAKSKKRLSKGATENIVEKITDLEQEKLLASLLKEAISSKEANAKDPEEKPVPKSRKSSEAGSAVKKERVALKAKRRVGKTNAEDDLVKTAESTASNGETEQQKLIAELMRRSMEGIEGKGSKKRRREDEEEGGKAVKKSKKSGIADGGPDTPTSSKTPKVKPPVKKYRQLTLTSTIPPGIAELSPVSAKAKSKISSNLPLKIDDLKSPATSKEPAETKTPPSKEKKKRKRDSSVSDLETGSKKHKPIVQSEMGSQDASFTSKFQSAGYAGPGSPLFQRPSPSIGNSQSDIDVQFESQDSIGLVANLETNQFEIPVTKKVRKSSSSRDKRKLDASIDFGDFGSGGNIVTSTQKQSPSVPPSNLSSQGSEESLGKPSDANDESPFIFKAPILSKGGKKKGSTRGDESGFESDGSASRKRGEVDGFESDVTLKLFRTQPDPIALAKHRAKKHLKNVR